MVSFSSVAFLALAYVTCLVNAIPLVSRDDLDVAAPPITYPTKGVVWTVGQTQTVTWDTSKLPAQITNPIGQVVLGWLDDAGGLNLQLKTPLASGFPITAGSVSIVVPSGYPDGDQFIVALIGSSGDISPTFTITSGGGNGGGSPSSNTPNPTTPTPSPPAQSSQNPDNQPTPTSTPSSGSPANNDVASPSSSSSSYPASGSTPSKSSTSSSSSSSPSGTSDNSNSSSSSDKNAGSVSKPVGTMVVSLLAASLVTLFL